MRFFLSKDELTLFGNALCNAAMIMDAWKDDATWSDWDRSVRQAITQCQIIIQREADKDCTIREAQEIGADARAYAHKCIERVTEMRKLDLERAKEPGAVDSDYYLGRAHRCDDILFWLMDYEAHIEAGLSEETAWWHKRWHQDTGIPCDGISEFCPLVTRRKEQEKR